jgi:hypothetical protein
METDWFGNPIHREPDPVACPRCDATFTDRDAFRRHLAAAHGVSGPASRAPSRAPRPDLRAAPLGQRSRSPLSRRLRTIPLVLVVTVNVVAILVAVSALDALEPTWWVGLRAEPWATALVVPMLWPTVLFLAVRGTGDL